MPSWCETIFSFFVFSTTTIFYSTYSAMSMAHAHVLHESWKSLKILKYETIAWLKPGLCMIWVFCVMKMEHSQTIWFCRDSFLWPCYFEKTWLLCSCAWSITVFMSILTFVLNLMDLDIIATINKTALINMLGSIPHQKFCFYHLPTRGRAGIKLGDADTSPT